MSRPRWIRIALRSLPLASLLLVVACHDNDDVTGTGGALAQLAVNVPDTVHSGVPFDVGVSATAVGVTNVRNGVVTVTLPSPLQITGVDASAGTSATSSGATATWTLNTLDSNTQSTLTIHATAALPSGSGNMNLTAQASMVADGITNGQLVATDNFVLAP